MLLTDMATLLCLRLKLGTERVINHFMNLSMLGITKVNDVFKLNNLDL
jgi:hypothetical protein